jgi:Ca2+-binding EF-hand superfamily protein
MKHRALLLTFAFLLLCPARARASAPPQEILRVLDRDSDGQLSISELPTVFVRSIASMDRNRDLRISSEEITPELTAYLSPFDLDNDGLFSAAEQLQVRRFMGNWESITGTALLAKLDSSRDGVVTPNEFPARIAKEFKRLDADADGRLTAGELRLRVSFDNQGRLSEIENLPRPTDLQLQRIWLILDRNRNGRLTATELPRIFVLVFNRFDQNRDGGISWRELLDATWATALLRSFDRHDSDGDGDLNKEELLQFAQLESQEQFETMAGAVLIRRWDLDKDARLSPSEFIANEQNLFRALDRNRDDELVAEELVDLRATFDRRGNAVTYTIVPPRAQRPIYIGPTEKQQIVKRLDENRDGELTIYETPFAVHDAFGQADITRDGILTTNELSNLFWLNFVDYDVNRDGEFSELEISQLRRDVPLEGSLTTHQLVAKWDTDKSGDISATEMPPVLRHDFEKLDRNSDRAISAVELTHVWVMFDRHGEAAEIRMPGSSKLVRAVEKINNDDRRRRLVELLKKRRRGE